MARFIVRRTLITDALQNGPQAHRPLRLPHVDRARSKSFYSACHVYWNTLYASCLSLHWPWYNTETGKIKEFIRLNIVEHGWVWPLIHLCALGNKTLTASLWLLLCTRTGQDMAWCLKELNERKEVRVYRKLGTFYFTFIRAHWLTRNFSDEILYLWRGFFSEVMNGKKMLKTLRRIIVFSVLKSLDLEKGL